jgi:hypothetical protein
MNWLWEGIRALGRPSHRQEDNIRMDLTKVGWESVDWIHLAKDRTSGGHHALTTYRVSDDIAPSILNLGTRWRWDISFTPRPLCPGKITPYSHWIGDWVYPRASLHAVRNSKRKILSLSPHGTEPRSSSPQPTRYTTELTHHHMIKVTKMSTICNKHVDMKTYGGDELQFQTIFNLGTRRRGLNKLHGPAALHCEKRAARVHCIGG